jgi:hypothetical protein
MAFDDYLIKPLMGCPTHPLGKAMSKNEEIFGAISDIFTGS